MGNTQKCLRLPIDRVTTAGGLTCFKRDGEAARGDGVADALHRCDRFADTSCCHATPRNRARTRNHAAGFRIHVSFSEHENSHLCYPAFRFSKKAAQSLGVDQGSIRIKRDRTHRSETISSSAR